LAIALLNQLGACPCGCIEGNLWVQSILRLIRGAPELMAAAPISPPSTAVDSRECDSDYADVAYVSSNGVNVPHALGDLVGVWVRLPDACDGASAHRSSPQGLREVIWPAPKPSARTLRAQLQVFLI
jgi:hypothetical protein